MQWFEAAFGKWVVERRWWIIAATVALVVTAASGTRFLTLNMDNRVFFSEENPQLLALEALENTYTRTNTVLFVVAPKDGDVFTRETIAAVEELTRASWQMPYSSRVDSITNFQHTRAAEDDLVVEDLVQNAASMTVADLDQTKRIALSEPKLLNRLVSPSGHVTGVSVNILLPGESMTEVPEVTVFARALVDTIERKYPGIDFHLTGGVIMDNAFGEASQDDMSTLIPLMFLTLVVIVGISLRSFTGTLTTLGVILLSMVTGLGLAGWLGIQITAASVNAPTIILTLAVADSVHILATIFQQMRRGQSKREAIAESLRINLQPVFLTSLTTAIGFLTMNFSDAPPFRDEGNIVAIGVVAAFAHSVLFLPALVAVLPVRVRPRPGKVRSTAFSGLADWVIRRRNPLFWGAWAVIGLFALGTLRLELQDDWIKYFDDSYDIRTATDYAEANLTGFHRIEYSLESGEPGGIGNPAYLAKLEEFADWYRQQPKVVHVDAIIDTMKRLNQSMHGDEESFYRIPEQRDLAAQYLLLYEMSLPFGLDLNNQINVDKSATRMIITLRGATTKELRAIEDRGQAWLEANAPPTMFTHGSGLSVIWAHLSERNINSMLGASLGALVLISVILIAALRSVKLGLISLVPNLAPAFMAFGLWGMFSGQAGLGLTVIGTMTLGIVVDDTVHFMSKYLRARREYGMTPEAAVRYSFQTVGTAMWITTVALVAGFGVLTLSGYNMNADMGVMTALTIILALALDFLFLPTLLMKAEKTDEQLETEIDTDDDADLVPAAVAVGGVG